MIEQTRHHSKFLKILMAVGLMASPVAVSGAEPEVFKISPEGAVLTVYPSDKPDGKILMMCPGGGYTHLAKAHEGHDMAGWFNDRGVTYAVLEYRMPGGNRDIPFSDAEQGMRILRENASKWGGDTKKIGIAGASAGGHLAATVATLHTDSLTRPDFQILFYPVISMENGVTHQGSRVNLLGEHPDAATVWKYSLQNAVNADTPRAFIMLSADDTAVPAKNSLDYALSLSGNGIPFTMHVYPTGGHGWGFRDKFPYKAQWTSELEQWLDTLY